MMVCDYLAIPSSSVPIEEASSAAKLTIDDKTELHSYTLKLKCVCNQMF